MLGDEASAINIQNTQSPKILHIATHSFYMTNNSEENIFASILFSSSETENIKKLEIPLLRSGIVLAGANNPDKNILPVNGMIVIIDAKQLHSVSYSGTKDRVMVGVNFYGL